MSWYGKFAPYNKAIESGLGYLTTLGTVLLMADNLIPASVGVPVAAGFGALGVFRTWYIKNETLVKEVVDASEDLYENVDDVVHPKVVAPPAKPVAPIPDAPIGDVPSYPVYSLHNDLPTAAIVLSASPDDRGRHTASQP